MRPTLDTHVGLVPVAGMKQRDRRQPGPHAGLHVMIWDEIVPPRVATSHRKVERGVACEVDSPPLIASPTTMVTSARPIASPIRRG